MGIALKKLIVLVMSLVLLSVSYGFTEEAGSTKTEWSPDAITMVADAVVARPLGLVSLAAGFVVFTISSPFSALGGNVGEAWDVMVVGPAKFTFSRPLGHLKP